MSISPTVNRLAPDTIRTSIDAVNLLAYIAVIEKIEAATILNPSPLKERNNSSRLLWILR